MHRTQISARRRLRRVTTALSRRHRAAASTKPLRRPTVVLPALTAVLAIAALGGVAVASSPSLKVARNGDVTDQSHNTKTEGIVVNSSGFAVYYLTGDSRRHPECRVANHCLSVWPPVTVASMKRLAKAPGVAGKLRVWRRDGFLQVTLAGHPLYVFALDRKRGAATGEGIHHFGGTWHVVKARTAAGAPAATPSPAPASPAPMSPAPCTYPPCY